MRSFVIRTATLAAAALAVVGTSHSQAATPSTLRAVTITDTAGDANGLNGQGEAAVPGTATPSEDSGGDIVSIAWATTVTAKKVGTKTVLVPTGMQVTMKLSGAPQTNTIYRVTTATADCTTFWLTYSTAVDGPASAALQHNCPGWVAASAASSSEVIPLTTVKVDGSTITWTVPASKLPKAVKVGTQVTTLSGHTRFFAGSATVGKGATVPQIDEASASGTYVYGK